MTVAGVEVNFGEHPIHDHSAIAGAPAQRTIEVVHFQVTIAGLQLGWAGSAVHLDMPVAGVQVERSLLRHLHFNPCPANLPPNVKSIFPRQVHLDINVIAVLMFDDIHTARAYVDAFGDDLHCDDFAGATGKLNSSVVGVHAQIGFVAYLVVSVPLVGQGIAGQQGQREQESQADFAR